MHVALRGAKLSSLTLYEPPVWQALRSDHVDKDLEALAAMDQDAPWEETIKTFLRHANNSTDEQLDRLMSLSRWPNQVAMAPTVFYDTGIARDFDIAGEREALGRLTAPTLIMLGGTSPHRMQDSVAAVHAAIKGSRVATVEGHGHAGIFTAPAVVAGEVRSFVGMPVL
jgi:pimeloyl-ACP methyl ester carboxylesterase